MAGWAELKRSVALAAVAALLAVGCRGGGGGGGGGNPEEVTLHGTVTQTFTTPCDQVDPAVLTNKAMDFKDVTLKALGSTQTGETTLTPQDGGCVASTTYQVTLPKATVYQVRAPGHPALAHRSFQDLESTGFEWSFD
jgi:hypothetical protein